jgi:type I restriction enzyme S subunit
MAHWFDLPAGWVLTRLDRVYNQRREPSRLYDEPVSAFIDGVVTLRSQRPNQIIKGSGNEVGYKHVERGDLVISGMNAHLGGLGVSDSAGKCTPVYTVLYKTSLLDDRFVSYSMWAAAKSGYIGSLVTAVRYNSSDFTAETVKKLFIALPPLEEQRRIADFLDAETARIDHLVSQRGAQIQLLNERRSALIDDLMSRASSGAKRRLRHTVVRPLEYGANEASAHDNPAWPRYIRITDIDSEGGLRQDTFRSLPPSVALPYLLKDGDLLFARSGATVGKCFLFNSRWAPASFAGYLIRARLDQAVMLPEYVRYFAESAMYWAQIREGAVQATIENVSAERYANLQLPYMDLRSQQRVVTQLDKLVTSDRRVRDRAQKQIELLRERRSALITAAVTGRIDVASARGAA